MSLSKEDRIAFSLYIVSADSQIKGLNQAKAQLQVEIDKATKLDNANKNLFDPTNVLVDYYQSEFNNIDGNSRTSIVEQDIQDSANRIIQNHFFPNDTSIVVPSLSPFHNIWNRVNPFALTYSIGKNYTEGYSTVSNEDNLILSALAYITSASGNTDIENTTGQQCTGTPPDTIVTFPAVQTLKTNLISSINTLVSVLNAEAAAILSIIDSDPTRQSQNSAAYANISGVILPALNTWLGYADFNTAHGQTTCAGFNSYNANLLAPTKLHSIQLATLQTALNNRSSFLVTRTSQLNTNLGSISQDLTTGVITASSGFYGKRYSFLSLRLNAFGGSLIKLNGMKASSNAQDSIVANIKDTKATYLSILPTSVFKAAGNGTNSITLTDTSLFSSGDSVFIIAEGQDELQRAIKSVSNDTIVLNDSIPAKYRPSEFARMYKDIS